MIRFRSILAHFFCLDTHVESLNKYRQTYNYNTYNQFKVTDEILQQVKLEICNINDVPDTYFNCLHVFQTIGSFSLLHGFELN